MASNPSFASTPNIGVAQLSSSASTTLRTAPSSPTTVLTAGASGTQIFEVALEGTGTTIAGTVVLFIFNGTNYFTYDEILITATTASTTAIAFRTNRQYTNLVLPTGYSLRAASSVASQLICITAHGGDL